MRYLILLSLALFACDSTKPAPEAPKGPEAKEKKKPEAKPKAEVKPKPEVKPETFVGKVTSFSKKAKVIQVKDPKSGEAITVRFNDATKLIDAEKFTQLKPPTKVKVVYVSGEPAQSITRVLVKVDPAMLYTTEQVKALVDGKEKYTLVDARPVHRYNEGHIPTAVSIFADDLAEQAADKLPKDKKQIVVFYCGGVTCGLSPKSAKWAKENGYENAKVHVDGMPGWKKAGHLPVIEAAQLKDKLDAHTVIIDTRKAKQIKRGFIPGAVAFGKADLQKRAASLATAKRKRLPGVRDAKAQIVVYGEDAAEVYETLKKWGYKRVAVLTGGFKAWKKAKLEVKKGKAAAEFKYVREVLPGSVTLDEFKAAMADKSAVIVDVRGASEAGDKLPGALNVPLDSMDGDLSALPKDKPILLYCEAGTRAGMAYAKLKEKGFTNAKFLDDEFAQARPAGAATVESEEDEGC